MWIAWLYVLKLTQAFIWAPPYTPRPAHRARASHHNHSSIETAASIAPATG
jgi:hypothetical protein